MSLRRSNGRRTKDQPTVILDLDGTLIDTAPRHYIVYSRLSERFSLDPITQQDYWALRRNGLSNAQVLRKTGLRDELSPSADAIWRRDIESKPLLELDCLLPNVVPWLESWRLAVPFVLVTVRSNAPAVAEQLERLDLLRYFIQVIVVGHGAGGNNIKATAVREQLNDHPVAWVGDTELDMRAAQEIGARAIGVTSGIRTPERLQEAGAEDIVTSVTAIRTWPVVSMCAPPVDSAHRR